MCMIEKKNRENRENNREKISSESVFLSLTMDGGNCDPKWR